MKLSLTPKLISLTLCLAFEAPASGQDVGITISLDEITFFDAEQYTLIATVAPPPDPSGFPFPLGDCVVSSDGALGYVSRSSGQVLVYDLSQSPPGLAAGKSAIAVPTNAVDLALSPDGRFLVVSGADTVLGLLYPITIVDLATRTIADTYYPPAQLHWGAAFGADGSVLYCTNFFVGRLSVDASGVMTDTGDRFTPAYGPGQVWISPPRNLEIAPDGKSAVVAYDGGTSSPGMLVSLAIPGLTEVSRARVGHRSCDWVQFSPDGRRLFAASSDWKIPAGTLHAFRYDAAAALIRRPLWSGAGASSNSTWGADRVASDAAGRRLYGEVNGTLTVRESQHGTLIGSLLLPPEPWGYRATAVAH